MFNDMTDAEKINVIDEAILSAFPELDTEEMIEKAWRAFCGVHE